MSSAPLEINLCKTLGGTYENSLANPSQLTASGGTLRDQEDHPLREKISSIALLLLLFSGQPAADATPADEVTPAMEAGPFLVIHGGAGVIRREEMSADLETRYREALTIALATGTEVLQKGGSALDAVEATIRWLEDSPLFNAGRGAVFTADGTNEMDASIMDGSTQQAGAVASVTTIRHPISAARLGDGNHPPRDVDWRRSRGLCRQGRPGDRRSAYFRTDKRWQQLQKIQQREKAALDEKASPGGASDGHFGTVGALALDRQGRLAAGTSTGGLTNKMHGRVGDSPILGAGTWAEGRCAVSGTGHGESFMRHLVAYDICARARYNGVDLRQAADEVVLGILVEAGGDGGVIVLGADGRFTFAFNTDGMYRGYAGPDGEPHVAIFQDESLPPPAPKNGD